jgi:protein-S-isoprenylcysteine O-methyltransferase Ste14
MNLSTSISSDSFIISIETRGARMQFKGLDKLHEKLPNYAGKRIALLPFMGIVVSLLGYVLLITLDIIPRAFSSIEILVAIEPFIPFLGSLFIATFAFWLIGSMWRNRERMKEKYGNLAYQHMIPKGIAGVFLIPPLVFHAFTSIRSLPPSPPVNPITIQWSSSLLQLLGIPSEVDIWFRIIVSGLFLILGALTVRSALLTFGLDYMTVVYLYFPEESEVVDHEIYSVVRHPAYFGGVLLTIASLAFRFSIYSIILFMVTYLVFRLQARREEKELVDRFGESYREYMSRVPALHLRFRDFPEYIRFLRNPS